MQIRISNIESETNIQTSTCVLPISVGQEYHEQNTLEETLKLIRNASFLNCIIVIADTLQRHNFLIDLYDDRSTFSEPDLKTQAQNMAKKAGDEWLQRNQPYIDQHLSDVNYQILRWDECIAYPNFNQTLSLLDNYYQDRRSDFSRSVKKICGQRVSHYIKHGKIDPTNNIDISQVSSLIKDYICEEGAIMLEWSKLGYEYMAYPSNHNPMNKEIFDCLGRILQQNSGIKLLNIEISEIKHKKKIKNSPPLVSVVSDKISLTDKQRQDLQKAVRDFAPLAINPIFTALRSLNDPSLTLLFLQEIQKRIRAIEDTATQKNDSTLHDERESSASSPAPSTMFHSLSNTSNTPTQSLETPTQDKLKIY